MFKDVYDAIDFRDGADAHYPKKVTFEKGVFSMREWVYDCWNSVCLLYTSPSPRDRTRSRMPSSA